MLLISKSLDKNNCESRRHFLSRHLQSFVELHCVPKLLSTHAALDDHLVHAFVEWHLHLAELLVKRECLADIIHLACTYQLSYEAVGVVTTAFVVRVAMSLFPCKHLSRSGTPRPANRRHTSRAVWRARSWHIMHLPRLAQQFCLAPRFTPNNWDSWLMFRGSASALSSIDCCALGSGKTFRSIVHTMQPMICLLRRGSCRTLHWYNRRWRRLGRCWLPRATAH
mmetsp:Transcript_105982/g.167322  ORF Transcript_105982/g.167322 Transcript_105982/m.167322 type:complete len:224 (+) Transcript_105982:571-1242(+)